MSAYVIADIEVKDARAYETYRNGVEPTVRKYGGRFIVRGGQVSAVEGAWCPQRLVVIEFPDMAALEAWYASPDYAPLLELRLAASTGRLIKVEGVSVAAG
jgi:uncharacterized protein (DUF1330 family)